MRVFLAAAFVFFAVLWMHELYTVRVEQMMSFDSYDNMRGIS